jgi:hypothetical protein
MKRGGRRRLMWMWRRGCTGVGGAREGEGLALALGGVVAGALDGGAVAGAGGGWRVRRLHAAK